MRLRLPLRLARFGADEDGTATIEFVILFPAFVSLMLISAELGMVTLRHTMLERGLDVAVRSVRLNTGATPEHDELKEMVCQSAALLPDCETALRIEMIRSDLRAYAPIDAVPDCVDRQEPSKPLRNFVNGSSNELMIIRACLVYDPVFPRAMLGSRLIRASDGQPALATISAFVQEPA